ncbi:MAG: Gfo/Idh/MocA family oxidoreductase [Candidatus Latescibacterota bacterium]|nr:Gfo/Idh/MocA family oxidoreductase [Candidatus Latescibacterota bacterium]
MIRLGVIGYGGRINNLIRGPFREIDPELTVVGIVDIDKEGVRQRLDERDRANVTFYDSLDDLVRHGRLDALAIGTRCNLHSPYGTEAAAYDLPLFLEKPVAIDMEQAVALEEAFENSRCPVVVSFPLRVSPLCELARHYIKEGAVGNPVHVTAVNYVPYGTTYWESPYRNHEITRGLFLQKATHDFDYLMYLMGRSVVRVAATVTRGHVYGGDKPAGLRCSACDETATCLESPENRRRNSSGGNIGDHLCPFSIDCGSGNELNEDASSTLLEFTDGSHGAYTQVCYARRDAGARGATVSGHLGTVSFDWYTDQLKRVRHHAPFTATETAGAGASHFGGDLELARDFIGVIRGTTVSRVPVQFGIQSIYACLAAKTSAEQERFVAVRQVGQITQPATPE